MLVEIGERIEALLSAKGWSQAELARRIGVSQPTIWKLVSGNAQTSRYLRDIARQLETSESYLLGETDDPAVRLGEHQQAWNGPQFADDRTIEIPVIDLA